MRIGMKWVGIVVFACLVVGGLAVRMSDNPAEAAPRTSLWPNRGDACTVYFRGDVLKVPHGVKTANQNGMDTALSGQFESMDEDWIVLIADEETRWIPRGNVLWMALPKAATP